MPRIEVTVKKNGETKLETSGFKGKACMDIDKALSGLSSKIKTDKKAEYYATEQPSDVNIVGTK